MLRASREEKFHYSEPPAGIPSQLGMAEARIDTVDDDIGFAALFGASGEFAAKEDFKEF